MKVGRFAIQFQYSIIDSRSREASTSRSALAQDGHSHALAPQHHRTDAGPTEQG